MTDDSCDKTWLGEHWKNLLAMFVIFCGLFTMAGYLIANLVSYSEVTIEWDGNLIVDERTSDGVAVIRVGENINYRIDFCNTGVDILAERWFDSFGNVSETSDISRMREEFTSSTYDTQVFYPITPSGIGCFDDILISQPPSPFIAPGSYYKIRNETFFYPNFLAEGHITNQSEIFYYADVGEELP